MRHAHAVELHRVTLPVVKVAHIGVVEVRDSACPPSSPSSAAPEVLLASAGKQEWSGGSRGRGGGGERTVAIAREARRASKRTNVGCVRPRGAGAPRDRAPMPRGRHRESRCRGYLITERGSAGSGSSRTRGDTPRTSPVGDPRVPWSSGGARLGSRAVRARLVLVSAGRARWGLIFAPKAFPAHQPAITSYVAKFSSRPTALAVCLVSDSDSDRLPSERFRSWFEFPVVLQFHPV